MSKFPILFILLIALTGVHAQDIQKNKDKVNGNSSVYYSLQPQGKVTGILVMLHASGEKPQDIFKRTALPKAAAEKGYITIAPELHESLFADKHTIDELDQLIKSQTEKYGVTPIIIGGLSSGGAIAVEYAEYLIATKSAIKPSGVFSIDAPLDLSRIYAYAERVSNYSCGGIIVKQGKEIKNDLNRLMGGSPRDKPEAYIKVSAYTATASDGGNAQYLKDLPIRLYCEPDLDFVKRTYCQDFQATDLNAVDQEGLNNFLVKIGSKQSQYIATKGKGFHSWNIIWPPTFVTWMESISK